MEESNSGSCSSGVLRRLGDVSWNTCRSDEGMRDENRAVFHLQRFFCRIRSVWGEGS